MLLSTSEETAFLLASTKKDIDGAKNRLQEYCQQRYLALPAYNILEKAGPDHSPMFQAEVIIDGMTFVGDWATRKRDAEKAAAMEALIYINRPPSPPKPVIPCEIKDPLETFEKLNLTPEEQQIEPMECA